MFQIALNLLQNAAQSEAAVVRIEADATAEANMIELRIQDDGVGIAEADLGKVLEPFYTTKPPGKGTGLGLPVVQKLVAEQGGSLRIASERGRGTTVSLLLPSIESPRA
jgi:signal transduction histidine kinase